MNGKDIDMRCDSSLSHEGEDVESLFNELSKRSKIKNSWIDFCYYISIGWNNFKNKIKKLFPSLFARPQPRLQFYSPYLNETLEIETEPSVIYMNPLWNENIINDVFYENDKDEG